jgi:hypothetical protein
LDSTPDLIIPPPSSTECQILSILEGMESHLNDHKTRLDSIDTINISSFKESLKSLDEKYTTLLQTSHHSLSPSPDNISSTVQDIINDKYTQMFQPTIEAFTCLTTSSRHLQSTPTPAASLTSTYKQILKPLDSETLNGDSLQELELFYDTILSHFNTVTLSTELYLKYRKLTKTFDFERHLCQMNRTIGLSPSDLAQAQAFNRSFGTGLHKFILSPTTIPQTTCPDTYLQLLSLCNEPNGFLLFQNLIFLQSLQLNGKFVISMQKYLLSLFKTVGECLRLFYGRVTWLHNEVTSANLQNGSIATLYEQFLTLL